MPTLMIWEALPVESVSMEGGTTKSTASLISCGISLKRAGVGSPEMFADVDTTGRPSLKARSLQKSNSGMRIPLFDFCRDLAFKLGRPVVSTSANISGEPTPARFSEIPQEIRDAVDFVVPPSIDTDSTGKASQIIKVGMDGEVEIIRM